MRIAVIGRGNVGGGLAKLWRAAGHDVTEIGRDGGDVSEAEVILLAVPSGEISNALDQVEGVEGKPVIDATNQFHGERPEGESLAHIVKSKTNGPVVKGFNLNFADLYDRIGEAKSRPGNLLLGDEEARAVAEQLSTDAGYDPVWGGGLENARAQEDFLNVLFAVSGERGPLFYRFAPPEAL